MATVGANATASSTSQAELLAWPSPPILRCPIMHAPWWDGPQINDTFIPCRDSNAPVVPSPTAPRQPAAQHIIQTQPNRPNFPPTYQPVVISRPRPSQLIGCSSPTDSTLPKMDAFDAPALSHSLAQTTASFLSLFARTQPRSIPLPFASDTSVPAPLPHSLSSQDRRRPILNGRSLSPTAVRRIVCFSLSLIGREGEMSLSHTPG